jgi:hypothetical protein
MAKELQERRGTRRWYRKPEDLPRPPDFEQHSTRGLVDRDIRSSESHDFVHPGA